MRIWLLIIAMTATTTAYAQYGNRTYGSPGYGTGSNPNSHYVRPHYQNDGNFVGGHYRTNPNNTTRDNYGASGNEALPVSRPAGAGIFRG